MASGPTICVIGAGPCGLTAIKNLRQVGLENIACFDSRSEVGGSWAPDQGGEHSSVYESAHTISSRSLSSFRDFPMPRDYPDYPSRAQVHDYFRSYAEAFDLLPFIQLNTTVERAELDSDGRWRVDVSGPDGTTQMQFDYLLVCNGHHWRPRMPAVDGHFHGEVVHSHEYRNPEPFRGRRVLVVGGGNSACDIAAETSRVSRRTAISMRRGYYIVPKLIFGRPADVAYRRLRHLPKRVRQAVIGWALRLAVGRWQKYGLEAPSCRPLEMHWTVNTDLLNLIRHGKVHPRRGIAAADGDVIVFDDGRREAFDAIVFATGYHIDFPFFDPDFIDWSEALQIPLYLKMMMADVPNLYFIGLFQPIGCIWTFADFQARIASLHIAGRLARPDNLPALIDEEMQRGDWRFERTHRHAVEVDPYDFERRLRAEIAKAA